MTIALFGSKGFVGSEILKSLKKYGYDVSEITRENFESNLGKEFDYVINSACPSTRFKAENNPEWDFRETVEKTSKIFYEVKFKKFIQISSVAARCQPEKVYGRHKLAAESIVNNGESLIVRLGPMFGPTLDKGVLMDMLNRSNVFVGENSKYAFAPLEFVGNWVAKNIDKKGVWEVGAKNSIQLKDLSNILGLNVKFEGLDNDQEMQTIESDYPDVSLVIDFMKNHPKYTNEKK
jgi:nucleoside-diphosphate-sugar epimerase